MTRLYLRDTTATTSPTAGKKSARTNSGTTTPAENLSLTTDISGGTPTTNTVTGATTTANQNVYLGRWSFSLGGIAITAQTWSYGYLMDESNAQANIFASLSLYVWNTTSSNVRGYVYDTDSALGTEVANLGQVVTFSGAAVGSVAANDLLVLEAWTDQAQSMTGPYQASMNYNGINEVTAGGNTTGSYIETPQALVAVTPSAPPPAMRDVVYRILSRR